MHTQGTFISVPGRGLGSKGGHPPSGPLPRDADLGRDIHNVSLEYCLKQALYI